MNFQRKGVWAPLAVATVAAAVLTACGGGGSDNTPAAAISSIKVMGDSLADSGTFGYKFTVQGTAATGAGSTPVFSERVASNYGVTLCPKYKFTGSAFTTVAGCDNYAVGGARINNVTAPTAPTSVLKQMGDAGAAGFSDKDLVVIDGGANDAADLIGAYLQASRDKGAAYSGLLSTLLPPAQVGAALTGGATTTAQIGGAYMVALANKFHDAIAADVLGKGATRIAVLNMPSIYNTPRLQLVLKSVAASGGPAASAQVLAISKGWIEAFNAQLNARFAGEQRVAVVDFYTSFNDQVVHPEQFSFTNATDAVCSITGVGADGLPTYTFPTCTAAALSATTPPAGATGGANWWQTYVFADGFHPTPYAHQLLGQLVARSIAQAGWL